MRAVGVREPERETGRRAPARVAIAVVIAVLARDGHAGTRLPVAEDRVTFAVAPIVSFQPEGYASGPYLSDGLGGHRMGLVIGVQVPISPAIAIGAELSSTRAFTAMQSGRFISGSCRFERCLPVLSTHRDTILALLVSSRSRPVEFKIGPAMALSTTRQGDADWDYGRWNLAFTAGLDGIVPVGRRVMVVPTARYHFVVRGAERQYAGLSRSAVRAGVGLRWAR